MGLFGHCDYTSAAVSLKPQQLIVLSTDGASETTSVDGIEFGSERITEYVRIHHKDSARDIAEGIYHSAREFAGAEPQHDDITSVIMKVENVGLLPRGRPPVS
jgi:sigma-B regulation protein RsbU (phosphoserine phosphatase)